MVDHKFIGIFGMMGSGKSVLINEFLIERPEARELEFTPPPVEAKFRGMDFEFVDQIFALQNNGKHFNFYELDAPTINKWTQFITIADAIIIAYNYQKEDYFESPAQFITNIKTYANSGIHLYFVVNACKDLNAAKAKLEEVFDVSSMKNFEIRYFTIPEGEVVFTKEYGRRVKIDVTALDSLYEQVLNDLS